MGKKKEKKTDRVLRREASQAERTVEQDRMALRRKVRIFYDIQRLRMQAAGRTQKRPDKVEIHLHEADIALLESRADELEKAEKSALRDIESHLETLPMWTEVLSGSERYKGVGPTLAGVILSEYDIVKADTPSKLWAFAGLAPVKIQRCKECKAALQPEGKKYKHPQYKKAKCSRNGHVLDLEDTVEGTGAARAQKNQKLTYNKWLRTKLVGVLGPAILKAVSYHCPECDRTCKRIRKVPDPNDPAQSIPPDHPIWQHPSGKDGGGCVLSGEVLDEEQIVKKPSPFRHFYDDYKHRKESQGWGESDGHRHNASIRYMVKMLLAQLWEDWRTLEGLPIRPSYQEEYLGHKKS